MTADVPTKVGGDGGISNGVDASGGNGGNGTLTVESGGSVTLTGSSISLGGNGGMGNGVNSHGGNGGNGTLTVESGGSVTLTDSSMVLGGNGGSGNGSNSTGGSGGNGTLNLSGALLASGNSSMTINANGQLNLGNASAGAASAGSITGLVSITNNGLIQFNQSDSSYTFGTAITGTGRVVHNVAGTTVLTGANTYSGGTTIENGTLALGAGATLSSTGSLNLRSATAVFDTSAGGSHTIGGLVGVAGSQVLLGSSALTLGSAASTDFSGAISGNGGSLIKQGGGTLTLKGANTYTGGTTINNGTLALAGPDASLSNSTAVSVGAAGTFDISGAGDQTVGSLAGAGSVRLGADSLTVGGNNSSTTFSGVISGAGGLSKVGTGTLTLSGANVYVGTTSVSAGTLMIGSADALSTNVVNVINGATLDANTAVQLANRVNFFHTGSGVGGTADLTLNGVVGFYGNTVKKGAANLTLNGANMQNGGISLESGTLTVGNNSALGTGDLTVQGGSNLDSNVGVTLSNKVILNDDLTVLGSHALGLAGVISGTGGLTKDGNATLTLTGNNSYSGGSTINSGTLAIGAGGSLAATGAVRLGGLGTLDISAAGGNQTIGALSGVSGSAVKLGSNTLTFGTASNQTFDGNISGSGGLTKVGAGTQTLGGNNAFSGPVALNAGGLILGSNSALGTGALLVAGGTTLETSGAFTAGNAINLMGNLGIVGSNDLTLSGTIGGPGSLTKNGAANLTLSGTNSYTGDTQVNAGTLQVNGSLASGNVQVNSGATLGGSGTLAGAVTVADGGHLAAVTGSTLNVGSLVLGANSNLDVALGAPVVGGGIELVNVAGNLTLDGQLNVSDVGGFGMGVYRLINYTGALTDNNIQIGNLPSGVVQGDLELQTAVANQVNLVYSAPNVAIQFWDGSQLSANGAVDGGNGTWGAGTSNWTDANGLVNRAWASNFAVFGSTAGTVSVDGVQAISGMQFITDGYTLQGGTAGSLKLAGAVGNTIVRVDRDVTATLDVGISGTDTLVKLDAGTLVLNAANGYTGGTVLDGGTLVVGDNAALGTGELIAQNGTILDSNKAVTLANDVTLNGALTVAGSHDLTLAGDVTGNGSLTKTGSATLVLSGANDYAGGTTISAGRLVASVGNLGSGSIVNNAALELNQTSNATLAQAISGSGDLTKTGVGTLTLAGNNTSTGGTTISAGKLVASVRSLGSGAIVNNAALQLNQTTDATLAQAISGSGSLTKTGAGALTLTGNGSNFAGTTQIDAGSLLLSSTGKLGGNLTVASGAKLAGTGTVGGTGTLTTIRNGATLAAGDAGSPFGTLRVLGDLALESGSSFLVQANPDSSESSLVKVAGAATLNGSVLHVGTASNAATDFRVGKTYTILSASQINGTFDAATSNFAYLDAKLDYTTANQVDLELKRKSNGGGQMHFADLANTNNQGSTANALESLPSTNALYQYVETLPAGTPPAVFSSLSGDAHSTVLGSVNMLSAQAPNISQQHLRSNLTAGLRAGAPIAQSDGPLPASAFPSSKALPAWVEVVGHWQKMDGNSNTPGVKQNTTGLFLGADEEVGNSGWRVGGSVGYTSADAKVSSRDASADISSYSAAVYTGKGFSHGTNRINVIGGLAYTKHSIESERSVAALNQNLKADYSAHTAQLFAEVGYAMGQYDKQGFEPFVGITLGEQRTNSFKESGGFAALSSESSRDTLASTTLGVRAHSDFVVAGKDTRVRASLGMRHAWGNLSQNRTMAFEGSSSFTVAGAPLARNTALVGLQAEVALGRYSALVLGYNGEYGSGSRDQSASVKVRWAF